MPNYNFDKLIKNRLKKLELKPKDSLEKSLKESRDFYSARCLDKEKNLCFFKANLKNEKTVKKLEAETKIYEKFSNLNEENNFIIVPKIKKKTIGKNFGWLIRTYLGGKNLGSWEKGFKEKILKDQEIAKKLAQGIYFIQCYLTNVTDKNALKSLNTKQIQKETLALIKSLKDKIKIKETKKIEALYKERIGQYQLVFSHGDLLPKNLLLCGNQIGIIDWKNAVLANPAFDLSALWVYSLNKEKWQKTLINTYLGLSSNQTVTRHLLKINNIYLLLKLINKFHTEKQVKKLKNSKLKFYKKAEKTLVKLLK